MFEVNIQLDLKPAMKALTDLERRQLPFATVLALNEIATTLREDLRSEMEKAFDNPTPFTLNAFFLKKARKSDPTAFVGIRDFAGKGTPAWKYLTPETMGGPRRMKRFEKRLSFVSGGQFAVPGSGAKLDQYGNMSRGQLGQLLSRLDALGDVGENASAKTGRRLKRKGVTFRGTKSDYLVAKGKGGKPRGVYQIVAKGKVVPVLLFRPQAPSYSPIFPFETIVKTSIHASELGAFDRALAKAVATAR